MELPLFEIKDEDFYDVSKRLQMLWGIVEEERIMLRKIQRSLFARHDELSKKYIELYQEMQSLKQHITGKENSVQVFNFFEEKVS